MNFPITERWSGASAYAHLVGDTLRTLASVVAGSVEIAAPTVHDTLFVDGALTLFVCVVIFAGTLALARETWTRWKGIDDVQRVEGGAERSEGENGAYGAVQTRSDPCDLVNHSIARANHSDQYRRARRSRWAS